MCARLAAGDLVRDILKDAGFSREQISDFRLSTPAAKAKWDEAREASADSFHDEALTVARVPVIEIEPAKDGKPATYARRDSQEARLLVDTLKWAARIRNPKLYGDKAQLDVNVRTVDLTRIIDAAHARLAAHQQGRIIDVTPSNGASRPDLAHAQSVDLVAGILPPELAGLM